MPMRCPPILLRDRLLLRVIGSPDPYTKHIDRMDGATSGTGKVVIFSRSNRPEYDVGHLFDAVAVSEGLVQRRMMASLPRESARRISISTATA
jgi:2-methylaconitate cis-trans-isomerase PrpF